MPDAPTNRSNPSPETRNAERDDAEAAHVADRPPTDEEAELAERQPLDPDVSEHEREMGERGGRQRGEGRLP
jgi:hypothetical protein